MTYVINCVSQTKQDLNMNVFNMITGINESKILTKQISWLVLANVTRMKSGIMLNLGVNVKTGKCVKKIIVESS